MFICFDFFQLTPILDLKFKAATVVKSIDMNSIIKKNYSSFDELREDFAWLAHNCLAIHPSNEKVVKAAKSLVDLLEAEIYNLALCRQCYKNAYEHPENSFTMLCDHPHLLLWVNCGKYGFWPSKLMRCEDDGTVTVRYFGDYTNATINSTECLLFSEKTPVNGYKSAPNVTFDLALQVSLQQVWLLFSKSTPHSCASFSINCFSRSPM